MKAVAFNGSARKNGNTAILLNLVLDELRAEQVGTEMIQMAGERISGCVACYQCLKNKDRKCAVKSDRANEYIQKMREADVILLGSPVYIADVTANMKALLERATLVCRAKTLVNPSASIIFSDTDRANTIVIPGVHGVCPFSR